MSWEMPRRLELKLRFGVEPALPVETAAGPLTLSVPTGIPDIPTMAVDIDSDGLHLTGRVAFQVDDHTADELLKDPNAAPAKEGIRKKSREFAEPLKWLLRLIAQEHGARHGERWLNSESFQWRLDGGAWYAGGVSASVRVTVHRDDTPLTAASAASLQGLIDRREEPLLAFEHLRDARRSADNRFAWIQAAVAAEIGIKEALVRLEPRLEHLLLEVQSPPIPMLYGSILKAYSGESSPFVEQLKNGARKRNDLIHKPKRMHITEDQRREYLQTVDKALRHLMNLCRGKTA